MTRDEILELLKTNTQTQVAKMAGVSRQRVHQIGASVDGPKYRGYKWDEIDPQLGTAQDTVLAVRLGVPKVALAKRRAKLGIPAFKDVRPDHCPRCETEQYGQTGYCHACYERKRRRERRCALRLTNS